MFKIGRILSDFEISCRKDVTKEIFAALSMRYWEIIEVMVGGKRLSHTWFSITNANETVLLKCFGKLDKQFIFFDINKLDPGVAD